MARQGQEQARLLQLNLNVVSNADKLYGVRTIIIGHNIQETRIKCLRTNINLHQTVTRVWIWTQRATMKAAWEQIAKRGGKTKSKTGVQDRDRQRRELYVIGSGHGMRQIRKY